MNAQKVIYEDGAMRFPSPLEWVIISAVHLPIITLRTAADNRRNVYKYVLEYDFFILGCEGY